MSGPEKQMETRPGRDMLVFLLIAVIALVVLAIGGVASLVVIAALLAYILDPLVTTLELRGLSRTAATTVFFLCSIGLLVLLGFLLVPPLMAQVELLQSDAVTEQTAAAITSLEGVLREKLGWLGLSDLNLSEAVQDGKAAVRERVVHFLLTDSAALIIELITIPFVMFFFLKDGREIKKNLIRIIPNRYFEFALDLVYKMDVQLGNFLRSQFFDAVIFGALSTLALWILDVPYFLFIGPFAGAANLIPYVGPIAGVIPAVVVSVLQTGDITKAMYIIAAYIILKLLDDVLIQPMIVSHGVNLHPVLVLFSILIGGTLFGILGMVLAVPCAGFIKVVLQESIATFRKYRFS